MHFIIKTNKKIIKIQYVVHFTALYFGFLNTGVNSKIFQEQSDINF